MSVLRRFCGPLLVLFAAAVATGALHLGGFRLNLTPSVPRGIYRLTDGPIERGSLVAACLPREVTEFGRWRGYLGPGRCPGGTAPVLKYVAAIAGDVVEIADHVRVNGVYLQPAAPLTDRSARPTYPYPDGRCEISPNELWLYTPVERSWDSRFFGPVFLDDVLGVVRPLIP